MLFVMTRQAHVTTVAAISVLLDAGRTTLCAEAGIQVNHQATAPRYEGISS